MDSELEQILISSYKEGMIAFLHSHPEYFEETVQLAVSDKPTYSWRAAWLLWSCMEDDDKRLQPHIRLLIIALEGKDEGHQRELLKILLRMELNDKYLGILFNISMNLWEQIYKQPSVRYTAFRVILKAVKRHRQLMREIGYIVNEQYTDSLSPGIRRSLLRMLKESGIPLNP